MSDRRALGSVEEVSPGVWQVRASGGYDPVTGKRRRPRVTVRGTRTQAEAKLAELVTQISATPIAPTSVTLAEYLRGRWIPALAVRPKTKQGYLGEVNNHIVPYLGPVRMDKLDPWSIDDWLAKMARDGVPSAARVYARRVLRIALRQAVKWRLLTYDPTDAAAVVKHKPKKAVILTAAQAGAVLAAFAGHALEALVWLALGGGLNRSEMLGLRWLEVDLDKCTVMVAQTWQAVGGYQGPKAESRERTVTIPGWVVDSLRRQKKAQCKQLGYSEPTTPVFASEAGTPLGPDGVSKRFVGHLTQYRKDHPEAGIPRVPLKDLRHSHGTLLLESGTDIVVVSKRLGHAQVGTTTKFYVKPHQTEDVKASARFEAHIAPPPSAVQAPEDPPGKPDSESAPEDQQQAS